MRRLRKPAEELRRAIDCLPVGTRQAMLDGIDHSRIIVGAYVDRQGGVCPMLAAHRNGGRTSLVSFAHAWDRYTRAGRGPRPATDRELRTLRIMLEASLALGALGADSELSRAVAEHKAAKARRAPRDTGERDRTEELRDRPGWAWLRLFRRYDHYQLAVREAERREREGPSTGKREPERV
jgi:hypothetical protein